MKTVISNTTYDSILTEYLYDIVDSWKEEEKKLDLIRLGVIVSKLLKKPESYDLVDLDHDNVLKDISEKKDKIDKLFDIISKMSLIENIISENIYHYLNNGKIFTDAVTNLVKDNLDDLNQKQKSSNKISLDILDGIHNIMDKKFADYSKIAIGDINQNNDELVS